jgi:hypothetical protein
MHLARKAPSGSIPKGKFAARSSATIFPVALSCLAANVFGFPTFELD